MEDSDDHRQQASNEGHASRAKRSTTSTPAIDPSEMPQRVLCVVLGLRDWTKAELRCLQSDPAWEKYEKYTRSMIAEAEAEIPSAVMGLRRLFRPISKRQQRHDMAAERSR